MDGSLKRPRDDDDDDGAPFPKRRKLDGNDATERATATYDGPIPEEVAATAAPSLEDSLGLLSNTLQRLSNKLQWSCDHPAHAVLIASSVDAGDTTAAERIRAGESSNPLKGAFNDVWLVHLLLMMLNVHVEATIHGEYSPKRENVMEALEKLFSADVFNCVVYYAGHGEHGSGSWCFLRRARVSLDDILGLWRKHRVRLEDSPTGRLFLIADCCCSGKWADRVAAEAPNDGVYVQAACLANESAYEQRDGLRVCEMTIRAGRFTANWVRQANRLAKAFVENEKLKIQGLPENPLPRMEIREYRQPPFVQHPCCFTAGCPTGFRFLSKVHAGRLSLLHFGGRERVTSRPLGGVITPGFGRSASPLDEEVEEEPLELEFFSVETDAIPSDADFQVLSPWESIILRFRGRDGCLRVEIPRNAHVNFMKTMISKKIGVGSEHLELRLGPRDDPLGDGLRLSEIGAMPNVSLRPGAMFHYSYDWKAHPSLMDRHPHEDREGEDSLRKALECSVM